MYMTEEVQRKSICEAARVLKAGKLMSIWDCDISSAFSEPFIVDLDIKTDNNTIHADYGIVKKDTQSSDSIIHILEQEGFSIEYFQKKDGQFHIQCKKE